MTLLLPLTLGYPDSISHHFNPCIAYYADRLWFSCRRFGEKFLRQTFCRPIYNLQLKWASFGCNTEHMHHIYIQLIDQIVILKIDLTWNRHRTIYSLEKAGNQLVAPCQFTRVNWLLSVGDAWYIGKGNTFSPCIHLCGNILPMAMRVYLIHMILPIQIPQLWYDPKYKIWI